MAGWDDVLKEIKETHTQQDYIRKKYLKNLYSYTNRNIIAYYSSWLDKPNVENIDINDEDMNGFMNAAKGMNFTKGLDLILHTPGGSPAAAEAIVKYLRKLFHNDIRIIVPQLAMSAGTMIACAGKQIIMGYESSLGPIDPQFSGIPAYNIMKEFEDAKRDLEENPKNAQYWSIKLSRYPAAFMKNAIDAIELSSELAKSWLGTCMFDKNKPKDLQKIDAIVSKLNEHNSSKAHDRHLDSDFCKSIGLKIYMLEDDRELQDAVLTLHHAYMITLKTTSAIKIIESQNNKSYISVINK